MEAESFLKGGYATRHQIESSSAAWVRLHEIAKASAPPRIKQILVAAEHGAPYLNTSQVFDPIPSPRKWLAVGKTSAAAQRFVSQGDILVMASATVGRSILATRQHEHKIISHHFLRVTPNDESLRGWIYAFIQSPQCQAMINSSQYASVIRHIEPAHLHALPIPVVSAKVAAHFRSLAEEIIHLRNEGTDLTIKAQSLFAEAVGKRKRPSLSLGRSISIASLSNGRRRLEGAYHAASVSAILECFQDWQPLSNLVDRVWWPNRFKRVFTEDGTPYLGPDELFTTNIYQPKKIIVEGKINYEDFVIEANWIAMARSGQIYGLNGSAKLLTEYHKGWLLSDDMIRIATNPNKVRAGYLLTALTHPELGRPLVVREAYGTSIPHLDPTDVATIPIVRLGREQEEAIGEMTELSAMKFAQADRLELEISTLAGSVVENFINLGVASLGDK